MYSSTYMVRVIKKRRIRWAGHEARMRRGYFYIYLYICMYIYIYIYVRGFCGDLRERVHLGGPGMDGSVILRWIFRKWHGWIWNGLIWLRIGTVGGHL